MAPRSLSAARRGFTLIELLIVVAIIAILAAIAVPNFIEAQTRAKASRVKNDHRVLATAIGAYAVDHNRFPMDQDNDPLHPTERGFYSLTTPVAYNSTLFTDPFSPPVNPLNTNLQNIAAFYVLASGSDNNRLGIPSVNAFLLISIGPEQRDSTQDTDHWPALGTTSPSDRSNLLVYDPTNGSVSPGDLYRLGGDYRVGPWTIQNRPWNEWALADMMPQ